MGMATVKQHAANVPEWAMCELPTLRAWRQYAGLGRPELAAMSGVSHTMLVAAEARGHMRGRLVNRIAAALGVPASILIAYSPLDRQARPWSTKAAMAFAARRLASVG